MNNPRPLISIITPAYNCGSKIEETILPVLSQQADLFEMIIIDGLSKANTLDILKRYDGCVRWGSQKDVNVYDSMNTGRKLMYARHIEFLLGLYLVDCPSSR